MQPSSGDPRDQSRYFVLKAKKILGEDSFELDRWADDGGQTPADHGRFAMASAK